MKNQLRFIYHSLKSGKYRELMHQKGIYSQQGEDMVIDSLLGGQESGFYVDVGAHHPLRYSNTQIFHAKGWRGINIDPNPGVSADFARFRPDDINLTLGVSDVNAELAYYDFSDPAVNTFDKPSADSLVAQGNFQLLREIMVPVRTLRHILDEHLPAGQAIDFLTIDVEGFDKQVLRSNDWEKYRPRLIVTEDLTAFTFRQVLDSEMTRFLESVGYTPLSKLVQSIVYVDVSRLSGPAPRLIQ